MQTDKDNARFCQDCGSNLEDTGQGYKQCTSCKRKQFFNPLACATLVIVNDNSEILIVKRARDPYAGMWDLPGGFSEVGETFEQTAKRELTEETGLEYDDFKYIGSAYEDYNFEGETRTVLAAIFRLSIAGQPQITPKDDISDYQFVPIGELDFEQLAFPNHRAFLRSYLSAGNS